MEKYNIICLSNQLWDYPLWTNKKHVMSRMPKKGNKVFFVDPPINAGRVFIKQILKGFWGLPRLATQVKREKNLRIYTPIKLKPTTDLPLSHIKRINMLSKRFFNRKNKTILWIYHIELTNPDVYLTKIDYDILVYDCVDNYSAFPKYNTQDKKDKIAKLEEYVSTKADIIFTTAPGLYEKLKKYNPSTYYTPNVGDYERFKDVRVGKKIYPKDIRDIPKPIIGFVGAVDEYKFDKDLLRKTALDYPSYSFVIIGPIALKDKEASIKKLGFHDLKNVYFLGSKDFKQIPRYLAAFDVEIIPYQLNDYTVGGCFPVKFHNALAAGLPVVVTDLPAYRPFENVSYISKSDNDFSHNIRRALEEDSPAKIAERREVAKKNTWDDKVEKMLKIIRKVK